MRARRRTWGVVLMGIATVVLGVLAERSVLLVAGVALGAWLIGRQSAALRAFRTVDDGLSIDVATIRTAVAVEEDFRVAVTAHLESPTPTPVEITVGLPVGATGATDPERTLTMAAGDQEATATFTCTFPTAGRYRFPTPTATITPVDDLFTETIRRGDGPRVLVRANTPDDLHVGQGGEPLSLAYGEHPAGRGGGGLTPEELRQYQPGDAADRIDWKATARQQDVYVREFEAETDRQTVLVVDHRGRTALGPPGATVFAYAREVALGFTDGAERLSDPLGCWTVGDRGVTGRFAATSFATGYDRIRTHLRDLAPTQAPTADGGMEVPSEAGARHQSGGGHRLLRPAQAARFHARLDNDDSQFATMLRPFLAARDTYVQRLTGDPLFNTVQRMRAATNSATLSIIVTDDQDRDQLREAVKYATHNGSSAFVFIAPRVLYESDAAGSAAEQYQRYVAFEEFRRTLDRLPRVTAFEIGPGDRLDRLLAARRRR